MNYTACAIRVLRLAVTAARWCRRDRVGPGHVLFGLTQTNSGATDILKDVGGEAPSIRKELERLGRVSTSTLEHCFPSWCRTAVADSRPRHEAIDERNGLDEIEEILRAEDRWFEAQAQAVRLTSDAKTLLKMAREEASNLGHKYVGTEHLLLGMLRGRDAVAVRALEKLDLDVVTVRKRVWALTVPENGWELRKK